MAEAILFNFASELLSTISSPAFEKGLSIWGAMDELDKLKTTIETVQAVLIDAERKQEGSDTVKNWIRRVSDVLYDADDLFDEVVTDGMLNLNPIVYRNSVVVKVKAIRKSLSDICTDIAGFEFVVCHKEEDINREREQVCFIDSKKVIGRVEEKKSILEMMLLKELDKHDDPVVISIVGIGGIGKTTLAQLIYNDGQVTNTFSCRWFARISDTSDEKEVIEKILLSIHQDRYVSFPISEQQTIVREAIKDEKFLLVLDDVWDDDRSRWEKLLSLLSSGAKGSKIIITTRFSSVARAIGAFKTHHLGGLSDDDSWDLFKMVAFPPGKEKDRKWIDVGREIVKKCENVPLAIRIIGGLLYTKNTLEEWESFRDGQLSNQSDDPVIKALKLSYDSLPSNLKHCFAYCSIFPKHYEYNVQVLIYLWIAQGYIKLNNETQTVEEVGHLYLTELLRRSFFQEGVEDEYGEIKSCKMHDLLHDFAQTVAGEEIRSARNVGVDYEGSWEIVGPLLDINRVRSVVFTVEYEESQLALDQRFVDLKRLRALSLPHVEMKVVSSSIGELKHLRYLDLSGNLFESLPDSITKLLNLVTLKLNGNFSLRELPDGLRQLTNLRYLNVDCGSLRYMPPGIGELTSLQYLPVFKVGKAKEGVKASGIDQLATLEQLKGKLKIWFYGSIEDWNENDDCRKLALSLNELEIWRYPGVRVSQYWLLPNLRALCLFDCVKLKYLPSLRGLPNLKLLRLCNMDELEYIEEEEASFYPCLEELDLMHIPRFKGWRREVQATPYLVRKLSLAKMNGDCIAGGVLQPLLSNNAPSLQEIHIQCCQGMTSFSDQQFASLRSFRIMDCFNLDNLHLESPHLRKLVISHCKQLKNLHISHPGVLEEFGIYSCPQFDKGSLTKMNDVHGKLPDCLQDID